MRKQLQRGMFYRNIRGDARGPMDERTPGAFLDQYGTGYNADGIQWDHLPASTGNIDLRTVSFFAYEDKPLATVPTLSGEGGGE